jgi:hypothetical protein
MRSISEMARDSGLSVSALRFYDGARVLVPAWVDPVSGYRWYGPGQLEESRLLARLRREAMTAERGPLRTEGALSLTRQTASPRTISGLGADTETADHRPDQYHPDGALQKAVLLEI